MNNQNDQREKIFFGIAAALIFFGILYIFMGGSQNNNNNQGGIPNLSLSESRYDFGDIPMSKGLVKHTFIIKNNGDGNLKFSGITTSCACTTAILDTNGRKSPKFGMAGMGINPIGWSQNLKSGESAELVVTFDPNFHGPDATGPITREIIIKSNDGGRRNSTTKIIFTGNVTK